jgi:hypothetical protein
MRHRRQYAVAVLLVLAAWPLAAGCEPQATIDNQQCLAQGYVYYLDGAGGGSALVNWGGGVKQGLKAAGYNVFGEMYQWETGLGAIHDQDASIEYKRGKAKDLAARMVAHHKQCEGDPMHIIALSAGTAIAAFTLEALPADFQVDTVVLLGASVSADHDMTQALKRVKTRLFIFTSRQDGVLGFLVPLTGTADRETSGAGPAGASGFLLPPGASEETRRLYAQKIITIAWTPEFEKAGNFGQHLDNVNEHFVKDYIAPLIMEGQLASKSKPAAK